LTGLVARTWRSLPRDLPSVAILGCKLLTFFAIQGMVVLLYYAVTAPPADHERLPPGLQLDPIHAVVHLLVGLGGMYVGFRATSYAIQYLRGFGILYLALAVLGTFTSFYLGMHLGFDENVLHWTAGAIATLVGFGLVPIPSVRTGAT
jgi:lysylphosphatidylglycerol synthetase-like protein (DUF2156 family)